MNDSLDERNFPDTNVLFAFCFSISIFSNFTSESFARGRRKKNYCKEWRLLFASWKLAGSTYSKVIETLSTRILSQTAIALHVSKQEDT